MLTPDRPAAPAGDDDFRPAAGGCACGALRFVVERPPLYVHCCHCTRCQRETGGPFAHHAIVPFADMRLEQGAPGFVQVPADRGARHWVATCPKCRSAVWNEWGSRHAVTRYIRVGAFDEPARFPPQAHIFLRSRLPWLAPEGAPGFEAGYPADHWPADSRRRWREAKAAWDVERAARARPGDRP